MIFRASALRTACAALVAAGAVWGGPAQAQAPVQTRTQGQEDQMHPSVPQISVGKLLPKEVREVGGLRPWLYDFGITFGFNYQSDLLGATTGGAHRCGHLVEIVRGAGHHGDVGAGLGERPRDLGADALAGAGDDGDLVGEPEAVEHRHVICSEVGSHGGDATSPHRGRVG